MSQQCLLGYPDRFEAILRYSKLGSSRFTAETELLLYALEAQAIHGPCKESKPSSPTSSWLGGSSDDPQIVKWQAWKSLGEMNKMEAMRLLVRTVEEEKPDWWAALLTADAAQGDSASPGSGDLGLSLKPAHELAGHASWTLVPDTGSAAQKKPLPRYEHGAAMLGGLLYVIGGNYSGRYLNDVWKLDPMSMTWTHLPTYPFKPPSKKEEGDKAEHSQGTGMPPIAGHSVTAWQNAFIILGGHSKPKDALPSLSVRVMDPNGGVITLEPNGDSAPPSRGSHTATLLGSRIYVFGGEDPLRKPLNDLWFLDLESVTWSQPQPEGIPPPQRSAHTCAGYLNRFLLVFGGGSATKCYQDLCVLDTHSIPMKWFKPMQKLSSGQTYKEGVTITPRAGHSGVMVGSTWFLVGGGNNVKGCTDMLALDCSELELNGSVTWHLSYGSPIPPRNPMSSEGVALALLPLPSPTPSLISPAGSSGGSAKGTSERKGSTLNAALSPQGSLVDTSAAKSTVIAELEAEDRVVLAFGGYNGKYQGAVSVMKFPTKPLPVLPTVALPTTSGKPSSSIPSGEDVKALKARIEAAERDTEAALKEASAAKEGAGHELALLRKQISTLQHSLEEAHKGWEEAKGSLVKEREKNLRVEAEIAELKTKLAKASEVEKEVEAMRRVMSEADAAKGKGLWGYISGS